MIVAFTGHRPDKLGGYDENNPIAQRVKREIVAWLRRLRDGSRGWLSPFEAIAGMALGVDQWVAEACWDLGIAYTAAVPFNGQENPWSFNQKTRYHDLLRKARAIVIVSPGGYSPEKMQRRNEWMVDHCDVLVAIWDGSDGGTARCHNYAQAKGREIVRINPVALR